MHGIDRDAVLSPDWEPLRRLRAKHPLHPAVDEVAAGSFRNRSPPQIVGSGCVVRCLEAPLWAFQGADNFREAVLNAVNLGNDAGRLWAVGRRPMGSRRDSQRMVGWTGESRRN